VSVLGLDAAALAGLATAPPAALAQALSLHAGAVPGAPPVAGTHAVDAEGLHFRPRFPLVSGVRYTARFRSGVLALEHAFEVAPPAARAAPRVVAVHPSGEALPENALRLYLHFSQAMTPRGVQAHVRLLEDSGAEVPLAFVPVEDGLWDPGQSRLTLIFHPGRVKRGVAPGQRLGPVLRAGRSYRLAVGAELTDAAGVPMGRPFSHAFRAVEADRSPPAAAGVRLDPPASPGAPLVVALPEPLDHGLLQRWMWVEDARGRPVAGRAQVSEGETRWSFAPEAAWAPGGYALRVVPALEDRAGNRFDRPFDRETGTSPAGGDAPPGPLTYAFTVPR
jgi:hypothetical protein